MPFDKLQEIIEKYTNDCIDKNNNEIINDHCNRMLYYLQQNILHKSRNIKINVNKKWLVWDLNPRVRIHQNLSLTP